MAQLLEVCANCQTSIGKLETVMIWEEQAVCESCFGRLTKGRRPTWWRRLSYKDMFIVARWLALMPSVILLEWGMSLLLPGFQKWMLVSLPIDDDSLRIVLAQKASDSIFSFGVGFCFVWVGAFICPIVSQKRITSIALCAMWGVEIAILALMFNVAPISVEIAAGLLGCALAVVFVFRSGFSQILIWMRLRP